MNKVILFCRPQYVSFMLFILRVRAARIEDRLDACQEMSEHLYHESERLRIDAVRLLSKLNRIEK